MLVASWWVVWLTTNELLFGTYVNNKLPCGMPSVVAFYYQLYSYIVYFSIIISMSTIVICTCHVERLEATSQLKHAADLCGHKKLSKLDERKNFQFKKGQ